jgi:Glycosyl hydrolase catalytic core
MIRSVHRFAPRVAAAALVSALACIGSTDSPKGGTGAGGSTGSGGAAGGGGSSASGGGGGSSASGGGGGSPGGGGATGSGGATGAGGATAGAGGGAGTGGAPGSGGAPGTGGVVAMPFKGVANVNNCGDLAKLTATWFYNWTLSPGSCTAADFVPMISGKSEKTAAAVTTSLNQVVQKGYKTVLGFNEPNKSDQSNLTVDMAVSMWPALTANAGIRVGSPATSADSAGQTWFTNFMSQVQSQSLRVDFIALHWYGWNAGSCDAKASQLESYVKWAEGLPGGRPIWITEWGCLNQSNPDMATVQAFYTGAVAMFAKHPRIERYAWYPWTTNNELVDSSDALTSLGTAFAGEPSTR